jgi:hypothetical protein
MTTVLSPAIMIIPWVTIIPNHILWIRPVATEIAIALLIHILAFWRLWVKASIYVIVSLMVPVYTTATMMLLGYRCIAA